MLERLIGSVEQLTVKVGVIESIFRSLMVEKLLEETDPIAAMRDYAKRVEDALMDAVEGGTNQRPGMMLQTELSEQFAVIEKALRKSGAQ